MRFERVDRSVPFFAHRIGQADQIDQFVGRETEDQQVERVAHVAVVIDPFGAHAVAIRRQGNGMRHERLSPRSNAMAVARRLALSV
ncbi:hypothetical protein OKW34_002038 [Paraburkholderia youngii]